MHDLTRAANRDLRQMKAAASNVKHSRPIILRKRFVFKFELKESRESFCRRGRGRSFHVEGPKTEKGAGTSSGKSGTKNLEAESIRSRAESTGRCVKLKTVTDFIAS